MSCHGKDALKTNGLQISKPLGEHSSLSSSKQFIPSCSSAITPWHFTIIHWFTKCCQRSRLSVYGVEVVGRNWWLAKRRSDFKFDPQGNGQNSGPKILVQRYGGKSQAVIHFIKPPPSMSQLRETTNQTSMMNFPLQLSRLWPTLV
jgi:hypothetical protein